MSPETLLFTTTWHIEPDSDGQISFVQHIDIEEVPDKMCNEFVMSSIQKDKFSLQLSNDILGSVNGTGVIDDKVIAWEFRGNDLDFEGYEVFERQDDKTYLSRAEFTSKDQMRTTIEGKIWLDEGS